MTKKLITAALLGASMLAAAPASAAVFVVTPSSFTVPPAGSGIFGRGFTFNDAEFTDYFTFSLTAIDGAVGSSGLQAVELDGTGVNFTQGVVSLFRGTVTAPSPVGNARLDGGVVAPGAELIGNFTVTNSATQAMASLIDVPLTSGNYFIRVGGSVLASTRDAASYSGTIDLATVSVPEPATWGMMLLGFGLVGASLRGRRRAVVSA